MEVKVIKAEDKNEVKLEITVEAKVFEDGIKKVYTKNSKYISIPGFRKGKAPLNIVEKFYGAEIFYEDAFNEIVPEIYENALKDNKIEAVTKPVIDVTQMEKGKDLIFTATVAEKPEVKLGKYKGVSVEKVEYKVTEEDIEKSLTAKQEQNSRIVSVTDRAVETKDITVIDFDGSVDGVHFDGGKAEKYELEIGSNSFIPGFEDQIIGMKIDEEKDINVKFPEDYFSKELAGKDAVFAVKLHEIKRKELPELDDEFAKDVSEFETLEELKASIKEKQEKQNADKAKYEKQEAAMKAVCDKMKVEIPAGMIELETENMLKDIEQRLSYQGMKIEQYLQMLGKTAEEMKKEYEPQAIEAIKSRLALEAIIKAENIEATAEEIDSKIKEMAENYGKKEEEISGNENLRRYIKEGIESEKAIDFIVSNAKEKAKSKQLTSIEDYATEEGEAETDAYGRKLLGLEETPFVKLIMSLIVIVILTIITVWLKSFLESRKKVEYKPVERDMTIDMIRGFLITLMIVAHTSIDYDLHKYIYSFHMIAFVIVSGYFLGGYNKR